ncbi:MAG TPA: c(7)-type cytochrome triheme domain-containing protein [Thermodesulfobacteriota bacterium]
MLRLLVAAGLLAGTTLGAAAERGGDIRYDAGPGPVVFRHSTHDTPEMRCSTCHTRLFPFRPVGGFGHAGMRAGRACGACHDGAQAFGSEDAAACGRCHAR